MTTWHKILVARHGQSTWNKLNKFTGWYDSRLTSYGVSQSITLSKKLKNINFKPDIIYCSKQIRAIDTSKVIIDNLDLKNCNLIKSNYLNERHYGNLTGYDKEKTNKLFGELSHKWGKDYYIKPPLFLKPLDIKISNYDYPNYDEVKYGESLEMTYNRAKNIWNVILNEGTKNRILVVSHSNTIKSIIKNIKDIDTYNYYIDNSQIFAIFYKYEKCHISYKIEII